VHSEPFSIAFARPHPFGFLVGVTLEAGRIDVPDKVLGRLDAREAEIAGSLDGHRRPQWVGGRLAARAAGEHFGVAGWAVLVGTSKAPRGPTGFSVSIAHKHDLAIALVSDVEGECLGVDLEGDVTAAREIEGLVLCAEERSALDHLPAAERDRALVVAFALKEATYKAFATRFGRVLAYHEARVGLDRSGHVTIAPAFEGIEHQPALEFTYGWHAAQVIAAVRSRRRTPSSNAR
jgi:4'-phosphopantetheinyl transferase EntD